MHIQLETPDNNTIRSYTDEEITVGATVYKMSIIVSRQRIISPWVIHSIVELNETRLEPILSLKPEIIIIGHQQLGMQIPVELMHNLSKQRVGIESMSIGAACRTFNVLLSEQRHVVAGIIFTT